ncbi:B3/4 domain-containing protein [Leucobacter sp. L43]|uniref:B3/B4 domain-containing protein n=1 Tax=Leucobacter sp. L43 TaxID=2798040 RepID=UPI0019075F67|nr:phenylalanine--tRNA ligase beta subunit-related protein [Leucobacter sp. L43]
MTETTNAAAFLHACAVDPDVLLLRPDYRALLLVVDGSAADAFDHNADAVDALVSAAEMRARDLLAERSADELPHVASWRDAYRAFGAKPQRTRNSLEALTRRAELALPRVNALTDISNAISVLHQIPLGGEDLDRYQGPARLMRAAGTETFDTVVNGETILEHPDPGEVVWCDTAGVTCRRWNWRQGRRTSLSNDTRTALFILDALAPVSDEALHAAGDALVEALSSGTGNVQVSKRLVAA